MPAYHEPAPTPGSARCILVAETECLKLVHYPAERLMEARWAGNMTTEQIMNGLMLEMETLAAHPATLLMHNSQFAETNADLIIPWMVAQFLPLAVSSLGQKLTGLAYVKPASFVASVSSLQAIAAIRGLLPIRMAVFEKPEDARHWLTSLENRTRQA